MPAQSEAQRRLMAADYARAEKGEKTRTEMNPTHLRHFMRSTSKTRRTYRKTSR